MKVFNTVAQEGFPASWAIDIIQMTSYLAIQTLWVTEEPLLLGTIFHKLIILSLKIRLVDWRNGKMSERAAGWSTLNQILTSHTSIKKIYFIGWYSYSCFVCSKTWHCSTKQILWACLASWWLMLSSIRSESHVWHLCKLAKAVKSCVTLVPNKQVPFHTFWIVHRLDTFG